jgi:hypothetical protein
LFHVYIVVFSIRIFLSATFAILVAIPVPGIFEYIGNDICLIGNDANQPVARHFNGGNYSVSDMEIQALCPSSESNDCCKTHEMHPISKPGTIHPYGINEYFS